MICRACYREVPPGAAYCPHCGLRRAPAPDAPAAGTPAPGAAPPAWGNPWEQRGGRGRIAAFAETLQESLFRPTAFFRKTAPAGGAGAALWYAVIVGTLSSIVAAVWMRAMSRHVRWEGASEFMPLLEDRVSLPGMLVTVPVQVALWCVVLAALHHVFLKVIRGARGTYGTTLKAVCYSSSAISFMVFPICGLPVAVVWMVVIFIVGLRELHRISTARAFWAWFLPYGVGLFVAGAAISALILAFGKMILQQFSGGRFEV